MKVDRAVRLGGGRTDIPLALTVSGALCSGLPCDAEIYSLSPVRPGIALNLPFVEERLVGCLVTAPGGSLGICAQAKAHRNRQSR